MSYKEGLPQIKIRRKSGTEVFHRSGQPMPVRLLNFWQQSGSDLIGNTARGSLAEYIVATALGLGGDVRNEWEVYDLQTPSGVKIVVESAAYLQSWYQKKLS